MTANIITVLAVVAGIGWLGLMLVSALRSRGGEEVAPNLQPGIDDQQLETRRLETGQKAAIAFSAFLAISLPLYFLSEPNRQEGFVEEFAEASVERGEHLVEEFGCYNCHGPGGVGGAATFVEQRSGVTVSWTAPPLNDIFYRYDEDEINFWVTFGRGNTPMPAWGLAGGGPMNEKQVEDIVNYLRTIQIPQQEVVDQTPGRISEQISRLTTADERVATAILEQRQVVAEIDQAPEDAAFVVPLAERAQSLLENASEGIDTDADGLADAVEAELSEISRQAEEHYREIEPIALDPESPDAELADEIVETLADASGKDPILEASLNAIVAILETAAEGEDSDGDGISDEAEAQITSQMADAAEATIPSEVTTISLDPTNPESVSGQPDIAAATSMVAGLESLSINTSVLVDNEERIRRQEEGGLAFLEEAQRARAWEIDIPGVAEAMGVSEDQATRAVALFNANCARCHTAGFNAGVPFTLEAGSGGFGPALWDGRPLVQFGPAPDDPTEPDLLVEFLITGSDAQAPYGLNGFGSGRMPGFGAALSAEDIELLALYLRSGNLDGKE